MFSQSISLGLGKISERGKHGRHDWEAGRLYVKVPPQATDSGTAVDRTLSTLPRSGVTCIAHAQQQQCSDSVTLKEGEGVRKGDEQQRRELIHIRIAMAALRCDREVDACFPARLAERK